MKYVVNIIYKLMFFTYIQQKSMQQIDTEGGAAYGDNFIFNGSRKLSVIQEILTGNKNSRTVN